MHAVAAPVTRLVESWGPGGAAGGRWDDELQDLLRRGILSGYALLLPQGACLVSQGVLRRLFQGTPPHPAGAAAPPPDGLMTHINAAVMPPGARVTAREWTRRVTGASLLACLTRGRYGTLQSFWLLGQQLHVVRRGGYSLCALSRGRALGLCVSQLPFGVLVATFDRGVLPQAATLEVERICDSFRS
eukprot:jgi/Mesvir1/23705/Mv18654-RA.1